MMLVVVMLSVWVLSIVKIIDYGIKYSDKTKKRVIAINIAKEWLELVFNIRDTNWLRRSATPNQCRLKKNPLIDDWNDWCENDAWVWSWNYVLSWITTDSSQIYYIMSWAIWKLQLNQNWNIMIDNEDKVYSLCKDTKWFWYNCPNQNQSIDEWRYFRMIKWLWVFDKSAWWWSWNPNNYLVCNDWTTCWNNDPKEYRFCSRVEYLWNWYNDVELCSLMTNFKKQP